MSKDRRRGRSNVRLLLAGAAAISIITLNTPNAHGQARSTATQLSRLSVFGGVDGTLTGLESGKNIGITAGVDLGFRPFFSVIPSVEVRGTLPIDKGTIDNQRNVMGGVQLSRPFHQFRPYGDVLFGRGQIDIPNGIADPTGLPVTYLRTVSNVLAGGGGVDYDLSRHFALKADAQYQRYQTPVTISGHLYSKAFLGGVVYRFDFNHHPRNVR